MLPVFGKGRVVVENVANVLRLPSARIAVIEPDESAYAVVAIRGNDVRDQNDGFSLTGFVQDRGVIRIAVGEWLQNDIFATIRKSFDCIYLLVRGFRVYDLIGDSLIVEFFPE